MLSLFAADQHRSLGHPSVSGLEGKHLRRNSSSRIGSTERVGFKGDCASSIKCNSSLSSLPPYLSAVAAIHKEFDSNEVSALPPSYEAISLCSCALAEIQLSF